MIHAASIHVFLQRVTQNSKKVKLIERGLLPKHKHKRAQVLIIKTFFSVVRKYEYKSKVHKTKFPFSLKQNYQLPYFSCKDYSQRRIYKPCTEANIIQTDQYCTYDKNQISKNSGECMLYLTRHKDILFLEILEGKSPLYFVRK